MCEPVQKPLLDCDWLSRTSRRCVEHLFFTYLNLVRIPKWNAGKRWYSGPSTSGRGGHGNGRGQALRVVRNGQGREISPYRCRLWAQFSLPLRFSSRWQKRPGGYSTSSREGQRWLSLITFRTRSGAGMGEVKSPKEGLTRTRCPKWTSSVHT